MLLLVLLFTIYKIVFFLLYVYFKIVTRKSVVSIPNKLEYRKKTHSEY